MAAKDKEVKSRKDKRKEARKEKNEKKHAQWVQHQQFKKTKKKGNNKKTQLAEETESLPKVDRRDNNRERKSETEFAEFIKTETVNDDISADEDLRLERKLAKKLKLKNKKLHEGEEDDASRETSTSRKKNKRTVSFRDDDEMKKGKTKFEKYLELETGTDVASAKEDLDLEKRLAKRLKVKKGKLGGDEDDLNMLFSGFSSGFDSLDEASDEDVKKKVSKKKRKKKLEQKVDPEIKSDDVAEEPENETTGDAELDSENDNAQAPVIEKPAKYVPPQLRSLSKNESEEFSQVRKRVRGLLNRLGESNVEGITGEMSTIFQSISRSDGTQITSEEILASCSGGPRGNEQYVAVFASLVSGLACLVGIDFGAKLIASLAKCFEDEYEKEDNLSLRNLTLLYYLYLFGVCSSDLIYDFMMMLSSRLTEVDVSTILTVLNCSGMRLRSDDPATMKSFIVSIQNKVAELKASGDSQGNSRSKRMEFMLETIFYIKNNKKKAKEDTLQHTRIKKWLQKLRV